MLPAQLLSVLHRPLWMPSPHPPLRLRSGQALRKVREGQGTLRCGSFCGVKAGPPAKRRIIRIMVETKRRILSGGEITDFPGHWKITEKIEGEDREWSVIRKPDGTYWEVVGVDIFPRAGGTVRFDIGDQIVNKTLLAECISNYEHLQSTETARVEQLRAQLRDDSGCKVHDVWQADHRCYRFYFEKDTANQWLYILDVYTSDIREQDVDDLFEHLKAAKWQRVLKTYSGKLVPLFKDKTFDDPARFREWPKG
jgi:hypothetical protein